MSKKFLTGEDCLEVIRDLSRSQGSYGRLYDAIMNNGEDTKADALEVMEDQGFTDPVDLILWIEQ